jgi:uncharacterized membrane protein YphA (DoxX/SURF4 family)
MNVGNQFRALLAAIESFADLSAKIPPAMKRTAFSILWLALIAQALWITVNHFHSHVPFLSMAYPLIFGAPFLGLAVTNGRIRWIAAILRLPIAWTFLQAVADRLGFLGMPGTPGVSWGDFRHFVVYVGQVNAFMPPATIPALALLATIAETTFGLAMLLGVRVRTAAAGSAALLFIFGTAMVISGLSQFEYGVYLMAAGALSLASVDASALSVDSVVQWTR